MVWGSVLSLLWLRFLLWLEFSSRAGDFHMQQVWPKKKKDTCTQMFIAALFIIAKIWKQPKCPSTDEWVKKMWYIYTMEYYAAIKNEKQGVPILVQQK